MRVKLILAMSCLVLGAFVATVGSALFTTASVGGSQSVVVASDGFDWHIIGQL